MTHELIERATAPQLEDLTPISARRRFDRTGDADPGIVSADHGRALYAYLMDRPPGECPHLPIPLHTVIELRPTAYGFEERRLTLEPQVPPSKRESLPPRAP